MTVASIAKKLSTLFNTAPALLTSQDQQNARVNLYAAPFDAMAYGGLQLNGTMDVSQERGNTSLALTNGGASYIVDSWMMQYQHASAGMQGWQHQPVPSYRGLANMLRMNASTGGNFGATATDIARITTQIEGSRTRALGWGQSNPAPLTIGFLIYASVAGKLSLSIANIGGTRCFLANVTVNSANTYEWKTVTIPGCPDGTWLVDNGIGMIFTISSLCGSNWQSAAGSWGTVWKFCTPDTTNFFAANGSYIIITAVGLWPGNEAPAIERVPYAFRSYDQEVTLCQRHFRRLISGNSQYQFIGQAVSASQAVIPIALYPPMRFAPSIIVSSPGHFGLNPPGGGASIAVTALNPFGASDRNVLIQPSVAGGLTAGNASMFIGANNSATFDLDARL